MRAGRLDSGGSCGTGWESPRGCKRPRSRLLRSIGRHSKLRLGGLGGTVATREAVYEKFGRTAEAAQLFETDLGSILLALEGGKHGLHISPNPALASDFFEKLNRKTLGQILKAVKERADVAEDVDAIFQHALAARNDLNHGFFEKHNFRIFDDQQRDLMIAELDRLHKQLDDCGK